MTLEISLSEAIMRRVRFVYLLRRLGRPLVVEAIMLVALFVTMPLFVSVGDVFANTKVAIGGGSLVPYVFGAVEHTKMSVQILLGLAAVCSLYLVVAVVLFMLRNARQGETEVNLT